jgi:glycosyltransferase involved in cell wall biosynthesis
MKISVVVPAYNEEKLLGECLRCIRRAQEVFLEARWETELIVCDNNSTDQTAELARAEGARVVFEPFNQISRARNRGASVAVGDWLVFIDADSYPSPALFLDVVAAIRTDHYLGGGATVSMKTPKMWAAGFLRLWNALSRCQRWVAGSFVFCETTAFRALGGFSEELFISEEIDFSIRLKRHARARGKRVTILSKHPLRTSPRKLHLYSPRDYLWVVWKAVCQGKRVLRDRANCAPWYDGRR